VYCSLGWLCKLLCGFVEVPWRIHGFTAGGAGVAVLSRVFCRWQKQHNRCLCASSVEWALASRPCNGPVGRLGELHEAICHAACARWPEELVCGPQHTTVPQIGCSTRCIQTACHLLVPHGAAQITQTPRSPALAPSLAATPPPKLANQPGNTNINTRVKTFGRE
jgi:hypothetical protein